jgi:hypothetical protein
MAKIVILTSEFKNYVPVTLKQKAEEAGHEVTLINPNECYIGVDTAEPYISYSLFKPLTKCGPAPCIVAK